MALIENQQDGDRDREEHHDQGRDGVLDRFGLGDTARRLDHQEQGRRGNEGALGQARQRLGLAVAEAVLGIGGGQCLANGEQVQAGGEKIECRIGKAGQHRHRMGGEIGHRLDRHQQDSDRNRGDGGAPHQKAGAQHMGCIHAHGNSLWLDQGDDASART